jgi:DNA polymerase-3 subunit epsilon
MSEDRIAVIDVETTGLSPWRHDRIIEVAMVIISPNGEVVEKYETLVNPCRDMGPTGIHRIKASEVLKAPKFDDIAGDLLDLLRSAHIVAGHNISFDKNFLVKEYERVGVVIPDIAVLCTCRLFGRNSLLKCCEELGIATDGQPHRALTDALNTSRLVARLYQDDPNVLQEHRFGDIEWPTLPPLRTPVFSREEAASADNEPSNYLRRIASHLIHDTGAESSNFLAYLALIDRVLEDRSISEQEENLLLDAALNWELSKRDVESAHAQYLHHLAVVALADGVVSETERRDLLAVAKLLGQDESHLDQMLQAAASQLARVQPAEKSSNAEQDLCGKTVCFTGELQSTIDGEPITREIAEALATKAGLVIAGSVTKKLDLLVVADPATQSSKAKKARDYGIRILSDAVFWRLAGIGVD